MNVFAVTETIVPVITAGAYSSGDVVGGVLTFKVGSVTNGFRLTGLKIVDTSAVSAAFMVRFYTSNFATPLADNDVFSLTAADMQKAIGTISVATTDYSTMSSMSIVHKYTYIHHRLPTEYIYAYAVVSGTPTYAATNGLTFILQGLKW